MNNQPLFTHSPHPHEPRNVNELHKLEHETANLNNKIAVTLTRYVGTMWTAYIFTTLALIGLFGLLGWLNPFAFLLATWLSQQFIQLVLLPIIMVGQNVLGRKSELQADEAFNTTQKSYYEIGQIIAHLSAQDEELLRQTTILIALHKRALGEVAV